MVGVASSTTGGEFATLAADLVHQAVFEPLEIQTAQILARAAAVSDPEIVLGLAFALRAPRLGHVGVDLAGLQGQLALEQRAELPLPADGAAWMEKTVACKELVDREGDGARPFVAVGEDALPCRSGRAVRLLSRRYFDLEQQAAADLRELLRAEGELSPAHARAAAGEALSRLPGENEALRRAVELSLSRRLSILTGGPGSGKTFAVKFILYAHWLATGGNPPPVALAAPTGKAARRLGQALAEGLDEAVAQERAREWIKGLETATLHRLLGASRFRPGEFRHGREQPLAARLVIIDEASMVDLATMSALLSALSREPPATLVLVGDSEQLASVEAGCVLSDLCAAAQKRADFPLMRLHTQFRTRKESPRQKLAERIAAGDCEGALELFSAHPEQLSFLPSEKEALGEEALAGLLAGFEPYLQACRRYREPKELLAALGEFCVLSPYRTGELGVAGLNHCIERRLARAVGRDGWFDLRQQWYLGRPILIEENDYQLSLVNGDLGAVVPAGRQPRAAFLGQDGGEAVLFAPAVLPAHRTVFAMTVHKAQGSQFAKVALVLPPRDTPLLTRELVYTAVTRAREKLVLIGSRQAFCQALSVRIQRASGLGFLI